ncbi:MAG TPA: SBBP repeat-containing protein [Terriglobia bacterium]|nr:SBBP repeat-containing protein [Terriglobia bacterium]
MTTKHISLPPRTSRLAGVLGLSLALGLTGLFVGGIRHTPRPPGNAVSRRSSISGTAGHGGAGAVTARVSDAYAKLPLSFEPNRGQTDGRVKFLARGSGYGLFLTGDGAVLGLQGSGVRGQASGAHATDNGPRTTNSVLRMRLVRANPVSRVTGLDELPGKSNYFVGNDPHRWKTNVPTFARVQYSNVYPGVSLIYYGNQRRLEYDFVVAPGADPGAIALKFETQDLKVKSRKSKVEIDPDGTLLVRAGSGDVLFHKPVVYQPSRIPPAGRSFSVGAGPNPESRIPVDGQFLLSGDRVVFKIGSYDRNRPLVIDPTLTYSTYLGGSSDDFGNAVAVSGGETYITGQTASTNFPIVTPEQSACGGCGFGLTDAFVTKLNAGGTAIVYSTYLGGSSSDVGAGIAVDSVGNAYIAGTTFSTDFPLMNPFQDVAGGIEDAFVTKLDAAGSSLVYSTYLGGALIDEAFGIALDPTAKCSPAGTCAAYVTGGTQSTNFPTLDPFQATLSGNFDAFVTKLSGAGNTLVYSTYLGGTAEDKGFGIAVDSSSNAYVTGHTFSNNFPTMKAFQSAFGGVIDGFVTKLSFASSKLTLGFSTYLGGSASDEGFGIALDSSANIYVAGETHSVNFPTTSGAFQTVFGGGASDAFVSKFKPDGSALIYSTYLGGSGQDQAQAIAVDSTGKANVAGFTSSGTSGTPTAAGSFPTANPIQASGYAGNQDAFVARLVPSGCGLGFATYLGGKSTDQANGLALDSAGDAFITGFTFSNDFPVSKSPVQGVTGGGNDAFVSEVSAATAPAVCLSPSTLTFNAQTATTTSAAQTVTLTNGGDAALTVSGISTSGPYMETNTCGSSVAAGANCSISVTFAPTVSGVQAGTLTVMDNAGGVPCQSNTALTCHTAALSGTGTDFSIIANPATASVSQGQSATFMVTVTPSLSFTTPVALTCSGNPAPGTCSFSPATVTPSGTTPQVSTMTITTVKSSMAPPWGPGQGMRLPPPLRRIGLPWLIALLALAFASLLGLAAGGDRRLGRNGVPAWLRLALPLATVLVLVMMWAGCSPSSSLPSTTPPGNYTVAISGTAGTLVHGVTVRLTVQ